MTTLWYLRRSPPALRSPARSRASPRPGRQRSGSRSSASSTTDCTCTGSLLAEPRAEREDALHQRLRRSPRSSRRRAVAAARCAARPGPSELCVPEDRTDDFVEVVCDSHRPACPFFELLPVRRRTSSCCAGLRRAAAGDVLDRAGHARGRPSLAHQQAPAPQPGPVLRRDVIVRPLPMAMSHLHS